MNVKELALELGVKLEISYTWHESQREHLWRCNLRCISLPAKKGFHRTPCGWGETPREALEKLVAMLRGRMIEVHPFAQCLDPQGVYTVPKDLEAA